MSLLDTTGGWPESLPRKEGRMIERELEQAKDAAKARVLADMPYVYVGEARLFRYHADTERYYVEVDVTHTDREQGTALVLCRVSRQPTGELVARRITV